jgi:hypothetical protein
MCFVASPENPLAIWLTVGRVKAAFGVDPRQEKEWNG